MSDYIDPIQTTPIDGSQLGPILAALLDNHSKTIDLASQLAKQRNQTFPTSNIQGITRPPLIGAPTGINPDPAAQAELNRMYAASMGKSSPQGVNMPGVSNSLGPMPQSMGSQLPMSNPIASMGQMGNPAPQPMQMSSPPFDPMQQYPEIQQHQTNANKLHTQAAQVVNPEIPRLANTRDLIGLALGLLLSKLGGGGLAGAAGMAQGYSGGLQSIQQQSHQNAQSKANALRQSLNTQAENEQNAANMAMQKAGLAEDWEGKLLNAKTQLDKVKLAGDNEAQIALLAEAGKSINNSDAPGVAKAGGMRQINQLLTRYNLTPVYTDSDIAAAAKLQPSSDQSQSENDTRAGKVQGLILQGKWAEAQAEAGKANAELPTIRATWFPKTAQANTRYKGALSDSARDNANAAIYNALQSPNPDGLSAADKSMIDVHGQMSQQKSVQSALAAMLKGMDPNDPNRPKLEKDLDTATAALTGASHKFQALQVAKRHILGMLQSRNPHAPVNPLSTPSGAAIGGPKIPIGKTISGLGGMQITRRR